MTKRPVTGGDVLAYGTRPEQAEHGVSGGVVQRRVVLERLPVGGVGVQGFPELRVALVDLGGQALVAADEGLAELGARVPHGSASGGVMRPPPKQRGVFGESHHARTLAGKSWEGSNEAKLNTCRTIPHSV